MSNLKPEATEYARMLQMSASNEAAYWNSSPTRQEMQVIVDEQTAYCRGLQVALTKLDMIVSYLVEKLGVTTEEVQAFISKSVEPEPSKLIVTE